MFYYIKVQQGIRSVYDKKNMVKKVSPCWANVESWGGSTDFHKLEQLLENKTFFHILYSRSLPKQYYEVVY